jgi:Co/Zn/Cd efflux system component
MSGDHYHDIDTHTPRGKQQKRALTSVSLIKGGMFVIEGLAGYFAHSAAMMADSAAMLEDTISATASRIVHSRSPRAQAWVAIAKAAFMACVGLGILGGAVFTLLNPGALPVAATMVIFGTLGLAVNGTCAGLLFRFRNDNINMKAAWKCLRNDMISNIGVLAAAGLSHVFTSALPDLIVGGIVATVCIKSAVDIFREAIPLLKASKKKPEKAAAQKPQAPSPQPKMSPRAASAFTRVLRAVFGRSAAKPAELSLPPAQAVPAPPAP